QRRRRRRRPAAEAPARHPRQGQPHPLERLRGTRVRPPLRRAHQELPGAPPHRRRRGLHPLAPRRRHRRRLRAVGGSAGRGIGYHPDRLIVGDGDELTEARDLAIDACGRIAEFWGFTRTMGRAFGLLYLSREPLAQSELQTRLGISVGSASMTLAALGRWGVVHKVWVRGQRREHYQAETDFWKMISGVLNERERREIGAAVEVVGRAEKSARAAQAALTGPAASRRAKADAD